VNPLPLPSQDDGAEQARWFVAEVHPHSSALKSWLRARFPRLPDIDDIAQIAFLRLWRRQSRADSTPLKSPKAVLFAIARNAALDWVRHQAIARTGPVTENDGMHVLDDRPSVVETVSARQELEFLADALRDLPTRGRQVLTLTKIYGFTEKQVAEQLGISENTVRTHVVRGMVQCTEYLRQHGVIRNEHGSK
jgi:RNA polymerase sigma factor (sigma-70 family)